MAVIKSHNAATLLRDAVVLDLGDIQRQAGQIKAAAEAQAARLLEEAARQGQQAAEQARAQAQARGHAEGLERGLKEGREKGQAEATAAARQRFEQLHAAWLRAGLEWDQRRDTLLRESRSAVLDLALKLAERLVHRVVQADRTVVVDQIAAALDRLLKPGDVNIRVHPDDRPWVERAMPSLAAEFERFGHMHLIDDPSVAPGGCLIGAGSAVVDATLDNQLRRIIQLLVPLNSSGRAGAPMTADAPAPASDAAPDQPPLPTPPTPPTPPAPPSEPPL